MPQADAETPTAPRCEHCGAPAYAHTIRAPIRGPRPGVAFLRYHVTLVWRCSAHGAAHDTIRATASKREPG